MWSACSAASEHWTWSGYIMYACWKLEMLKVENFFLNMRNYFPGTRREFSTTWWCHTRDPELPMRPRLLTRSCALLSCKFEESRLNIKHHYAQLQQWAFDVHCIALSRGQRTIRSFSQTGLLGMEWRSGRSGCKTGPWIAMIRLKRISSASSVRSLYVGT